MSNCIDDFWNEVAVSQMASGKAPSVITEKMRKALDGDKDAAKQIETEIDVKSAAVKGLLHMRDNL